MRIPDEAAIAEYHTVVTHPSYSLSFLQPGRLVRIEHQGLNFGWGVIINYQKRLPAKVLRVLRVPRGHC
jgi:hypothetical protein